MPLTIDIDRANQLQIEDGRAVVTELEITPGDDVSFRYSGKTFETVTCVSQAGTNPPQTITGRSGKLVVSTIETVFTYTLDFSATLTSGAQASNVSFTLKKKSSGTSRVPGVKGKPEADE